MKVSTYMLLMNMIALDQVSNRKYWTDNIDPIAIHYFRNVGLHWYGLMYVFAGLTIWLLCHWWVRQGRLPIASDQVAKLVFGYAGIGGVAGARLGYCLLYDFDRFCHHPWEVFAVWQGGMASYGAIAGMLVAAMLFNRRRNLDPWPFLDAGAVACAIAIFFVRIGNFLNGELWGRPATVPWAVIFPRAPLVDGMEVPRHPSQLYAAGLEGLLVFLIAGWAFRRFRSRSGFTFGVALMVYAIGRFADEFCHDPGPGHALLWGWMSQAQLFTLPILTAGVVLACWRGSAAGHAGDKPL
ncbi:MAG: prolipoprotein diacylglyceryl transferase [Terracidiphilus sp.]